MRFEIRYSCISHVGKVRRSNQDNFICPGRRPELPGTAAAAPVSGVVSSVERSVFGVFDGMGGEECGEIAAAIAAEDAAAMKIGRDALSDLSRFCRKANADICAYASENGIFSMGTTAAMLAFTEKEISLCNIGDSRIFRICDGEIEQISEDHVSVSAFGMKPPLSQNLGIPESELIIEPYLAHGAYRDGDIYLICSDGLTDMLTTEEISGAVVNASVETACTSLLETALSNGGKDNITIILCKIERTRGWFFKRKRDVGKGA